MKYHQITSEERYMIARLRARKFPISRIAALLQRHRSTIYRELERNSCNDGGYRHSKAQSRTCGRRSRSRRNEHFTDEHWEQVEALLREKWSPEQIAGRHRLEGGLSISHETIYKHVWNERRLGGSLYLHLRGSKKKRRKRYGAYDSRGILAGKRHITERPTLIEDRSQIGHWEIDTVMGTPNQQHCIVTIVERKTGYLLIGKLRARRGEFLTPRTIDLIKAQPRKVLTCTADNGTEFHQYKQIEGATGVKFYFATPYHSWERGTNENTNGLIRQYLPKGKSMATLTQRQCNDIATKLNQRPRKRLGYRTPEECYET